MLLGEVQHGHGRVEQTKRPVLMGMNRIIVDYVTIRVHIRKFCLSSKTDDGYKFSILTLSNQEVVLVVVVLIEN